MARIQNFNWIFTGLCDTKYDYELSLEEENIETNKHSNVTRAIIKIYSRCCVREHEGGKTQISLNEEKREKAEKESILNNVER